MAANYHGVEEAGNVAEVATSLPAGKARAAMTWTDGRDGGAHD